jgi:hypothetical protein
VDLFCRDQRVPQWIDIAVAYRGAEHSHLSIICCGRYHCDDARLYYYDQGTQPFGIKSPTLPPGYKEGTRFWLPREREHYERLRRFYGITAEAGESDYGQSSTRNNST